MMPKYLIILLVIALPLMSCSWFQKQAAEPTPQLNQPQTSVSWTLEDSQAAAHSLAGEVLSLKWLSDFTVKYERTPVMMVDKIRNLTDEDITMDSLIKEFSRELMKGGKVRIVTLREDRPDPSDPKAQTDSAKNVDYVFKGTLDRNGSLDDGARSRLYFVDLTMADNHSGEMVWQGQFRLQKQNLGN